MDVDFDNIHVTDPVWCPILTEVHSFLQKESKRKRHLALSSESSILACKQLNLTGFTAFLSASHKISLLTKKLLVRRPRANALSERGGPYSWTPGESGSENLSTVASK